ncbi:MAG: iron-sulfur cluster assembly accessory protein [Acidobacteriota bacterium]|jgi:iron-sulfur cluster assembly protein
MIHVTEQAQKKIRQMLEADDKQGFHLRLSVQGGGCSGMQYGLSFDDTIQDDDQQFEYEGFKVLVDPASHPMLDGMQVDYRDSLMDGGFKLHNPKATATCGCGQSFSC